MPFRQVLAGVYQLNLGLVNCFMLQTDDGPVLIDTGMPEHGGKILEQMRAAGLEKPAHILLTHCHPDHAGGLSFLRAETGARTWAHPDDARLIAEGVGARPLHPAPGAFNKWVMLAIAKYNMAIPACPIDRQVENGHMLPGGLLAIHTPGHTAGHLSYFWPERKLLVAGDVATHLGWLRPMPIYEDYETGLQSLRKLADLKFDIALFGHGTPIRENAVGRFRDRFPG